LNFKSGTLYIDGVNGRVGIGTTTPASLLTVGGNTQIGNFVFKPTSTTTGNLALYDSGNNPVIIFDEYTANPHLFWGQNLSSEFEQGSFENTITTNDRVYLEKSGNGTHYNAGTFTTINYEWQTTAGHLAAVDYEVFTATTRLPSASTSISALIEVSDDNFSTVKDSRTLELVDDTRTYDIYSLADSRYVRVKFDFQTADASVSPHLIHFEIQALMEEGGQDTENDLSVEQNEEGQIVQTDVKAELANLGLVVSDYGVLEVETLKAKKVVAEETTANTITALYEAVVHGVFKSIVKVAKMVVEGRTIVFDNAATAEDSMLEVASEDAESLSFITYSIVSPRKEIMVSGSGKLLAGEDGKVEAKIVFHPYFSAILSEGYPIRVVVTPTTYINGNLYVAEKSIYGFTVKEINSQDPDAEFDWIVTARLTDAEKAQEVLETTETIASQEVAPPAGVATSDAICQNGANRSCSTEIGACQIGVEICEQGVWGECIGAVFPTEEICDGVDNDCDGEVDEGNVCSGVKEVVPPAGGPTSTDSVVEPEPESEPEATSTEPIVESDTSTTTDSITTDSTTTSTEPIIDNSTTTDSTATSTSS